ncbi:phosphatase PAP2 family protein [Mangrovibacterium diazotrophicum]|uniref:PAP2 superfamily protein n=1 Tax=Mangrovibacterium diazotrophicum TaxID=1261403 RepID=A0A419W9L5_9BACT|nr:phosphatase PAP2 family protein [Mangrovibacterium diazotrophicum]RKD92147.1 PAP2 superfamily protein [Mangrovibacterium diazotrophicum]
MTRTLRLKCVLTISLFSMISPAFLRANSAQKDSTQTIETPAELKFKPQALIVPSVLIGFGVVGLESDWIKSINGEIKEEINENVDEGATIDNFTQYMPMVSVYALNAMGIKGKHNLKDRTVIIATAYLIMGVTVTTIKNTTKVMRPDGSSRNSFPSGHTATAFMGAEFLYQEYKDQSIWYGVAGYSLAAATGFYRMYNDRHWLTDVAAGAGIGILSTKIAYWVHPVFKSKNKKPQGPDKLSLESLVPYSNGKQTGVCMLLRF